MFRFLRKRRPAAPPRRTPAAPSLHPIWTFGGASTGPLTPAEVLKGLIELVPEGVAVTDELGRYILLNQTAAKILSTGATEDILDGPSVFGIFKPDGKTPFPSDDLPLSRALRGEDSSDVLFFVRTPSLRDGAWVRSGGKTLRDNRGVIRGALLLLQPKAALDEDSTQKQKMEAMGRLAGGVAHDFNNLLTTILGYADLVKTRAPGDPDVEEIIKAGRRAGALTNQLLAFSRRQVLHPTVVDLNAVVSGMKEMLKRLIGETIELSTTLDPDPACIKADRSRIEQVILNLVVNARDAMPQGGKLILRTENVGDHVLLAVTDTGVGMDAATQSHLFEPFFTTKERGKGTGLGLSTVYGIVDQSGGSIEVDSQVGGGTTFRIAFPKEHSAPQPERPHTSIAGTRAGTETVLFVEDEDALRMLGRRILQSKGYTVLEAENGRDALDILRAHDGPVHVVVTDVMMPEMSGPELAEQVKKLYPDARIVFMSGYPDKQIVGDAAFLQKPFGPGSLLRTIGEVLDRRP